jgi:hypothetical protein
MPPYLTRVSPLFYKVLFGKIVKRIQGFEGSRVQGMVFCQVNKCLEYFSMALNLFFNNKRMYNSKMRLFFLSSPLIIVSVFESISPGDQNEQGKILLQFRLVGFAYIIDMRMRGQEAG